MKKSLVWVVLLGFVLTLNSCGNDDPEPVSLVVGTWSRAEYEFTELPTGFAKYWEGFKVDTWQESNYIFVFKEDGTYTRSFTLPNPFNLNDKGKWTLDGTAFKVSPEDTDDLDLIDNLEAQYSIYPGVEFSVKGEISDTRMELTRIITFTLASDAGIDATPEGEDIPEEYYHAVDVTVVYRFNRVN
jgi:hypothetical protein